MGDEEEKTDPSRVSNSDLLAFAKAEADANQRRHNLVISILDDHKRELGDHAKQLQDHGRRHDAHDLRFEAVGRSDLPMKALVFLVGLHWLAPGGLPALVEAVSRVAR